MIRRGIPKCFECQKLATIKCYECLNEFEEPKTFCFVCDNQIHKQIERQHQKEKISFNQQLDLGNQYNTEQQGQNYQFQQERRLPSRNIDQRSEVNNFRQINPQQIEVTDNSRENLQFFRDLKYTSNHQSVKSNIADRFKNVVSDPFYSNKNQQNQNQINNFNLRQDYQQHNANRGLSNQHSNINNYHYQHNNSLQNEHNFAENFEQRYQHKLNVKKYQRNQFLDNQLLSNASNNNDSFVSNEEDRLRPNSNPLQQGLSDEEGDTRGLIKQNQGLTFQQKNNSIPNYHYTKNSEQFKQQLEQEINDLKKYQNMHYSNNNRVNSIQSSQEQAVQSNFTNQEPAQQEFEYKDRSAEEQYKSIKNDLKQYCGQKDLDERENEVLKRINEIKKRIKPVQEQENIQSEDFDKKNKLNYNHRESHESKEQAVKDLQQNNIEKNGKNQTFNSVQNREKLTSVEQANSAKKLKNNFENLIGQVGPNEEKSYIEGLKNIYQQEIKNLEIKHKIKIQELENTISYMRQHMDLMEDRNKENIAQIQQDLMKQQRAVIEQERDSKFGLNELRLQYQEEINHLSLALETEKAKSIQLEKKMSEYQQHYQMKLREMSDLSKKSKLDAESERVKLQEYIDEMEEKIEDVRVKMVQDNELALQKIKIDYESSIEDLKDQIKEKSEQIAKLEQQLVTDSSQQHEKERLLKKENQELERQINQLKNELNKVKENTEQFKHIATDQEKELELARRENELLEEQKQKLEEEKIKLEEQVEKFQKYIYGDKKENSILQKLKGASSRQSLSRASSASIKSSTSKNNRKQENQ
ncbi:hypothetical protein TTHERM_01015940 (macronuclear) [Tetrahymena thermophila SB210]|uniref:Uncharacterized protein n=1 Tax=Tetrahymena thermophila (strain SB210) TaxID=312017 RepID=Q22CU7_TETTS|nr:hypothetical protein TTHERM_01015940 [Tetrahymena thermophila SB210]EAR83091.2 hypothetical protein TTHERM_01015940 [Tetrahymena thermophila SB210]|eukprot:XP_001030754.2 hypothetical protein TTHERM_01015940 [Tetrahymena thermophila SB210]